MDDVDLASKKLIVRHGSWNKKLQTPKGRRTREVPLGNDATQALKAHRHLREFVFSHSDGKILSRFNCKWPLWRACKKAGLRRIGWHTLRHTFASHLIMKGVPIKVVQELLGHQTIQMTMRYSHLSPDIKCDAVNLLDHGSSVAVRSDGICNCK